MAGIALASLAGTIAVARSTGTSAPASANLSLRTKPAFRPPLAATRRHSAGELKRRPASLTLYRALLRTAYSPLPSDFTSAKAGLDEPTPSAKRHHALGSVLVTIDNGAAAVRYTVFPTAADAAASFREPLLKTKGVIALRPMGKVPGYRQPSRWANGTLAEKTTLGKTVEFGFTAMALRRGNVVLSAAIVSVESQTSGDVDGTIRLLGSALAHLRRVQVLFSAEKSGAARRT